MTGSGDRERLLGRWRNTAGEQTRGIVEVEVTPSATGIRVAPRVVGTEGRIAWPPIDCRVYACGEEDRQPGAAALGIVELDEMSVELQLRVNKGILCVMSWTRFRLPGRHAWVTRELFTREVEP